MYRVYAADDDHINGVKIDGNVNEGLDCEGRV